MNKILLISFLGLIGVQFNVTAEETFAAAQRTEIEPLSPEEIIQIRNELQTTAVETLERLYKENPDVKQEIDNAYGYGVFADQTVNLVLYVAGKGLGVVYDNATKTPIYMDAYRAGTGPGIGYKASRFVVIFDNELVYDQFTTIGLQLSASGDAHLKLAGKGVGTGESASLVPGVSLYQMVDTGLVLQANWGATEFIKDSDLNDYKEEK